VQSNVYTSWERNDETDLSKCSIAVNMQAHGSDTTLGKALVIRIHVGIYGWLESLVYIQFKLIHFIAGRAVMRRLRVLSNGI